MAIADFTFREATAWVTGTATVLPTYPADVANGTTAADDIVYMTVVAKPDTTTITPSGSWTLVEENTGGSGAVGADTGPTKTGVWKRSVPGGGLTTTTTVTLTGASVAMASMSSYRPVVAGRTPVWTEDIVAASVTTASTNMAATAAASSSITIADGVHVAVVCASPSDAATTQPVSTIVASGATIATPAVAPGSGFDATGNDIAVSRYTAEVTAGTSSAAPSITGTAAASTTRAVIWQVIRLDQTSPTTSAPAGNASGTGAAYDATVTTTGSANAPAELATGTGAALAPTVHTTASVAAGLASGTGSAGDAKPTVSARAELAAGTGTAQVATDTTDSFVSAGLASGTGAARQPTVSTEDPVGVPFLHGQLDAAQLAVEVAFGADLTADDAAWTWTDISDSVRYDSGIALKHGRADEAATSQPATAKMTLDNRTGEFSRGGQSSNWPYVRLNTPVRVSVDSGSGTYQVIFFGFADSWQPAWDRSGRDATVELAASGTLRRLAQGTAPLVSPFRRAITARTDVVAYWPCEEPKRAQAISSGLTDGTAMAISGSAEYPYPKFAESDEFPCSLPLPMVNQTTWRGAVAPYTATNAVMLRFLAVFPRDALSGTECVVASVFTGGSAVRWDIAYVNTLDGDLKLYVTNSAGTRTQLAYGAYACNDTTRWVSLELTQIGTGVFWQLEVIGLGLRTEAAVNGTFALNNITSASAVAIGPDGDVADLAVGHITVQDAVSLLVTVGSDLDVFNSFSYESPTERVARLCDEAGVPVTIVGTSTLQMGSQSIDKLVPLLRECEVADGGLLYDGLDNGLTYVAGSERINTAAALTLSATTGQIGNPEPIDDDQRTRNKVTAKGTNGGEAVYEDSDGELGTAAVGVYDDKIDVNIVWPDDLIDHASRQVALGTVPGYRYPRIDLAIHHDPDLIDDWLAVDPSARIDVTGIDDVRTQHPDGTVSLLLEGYSQKIDQYLWDIKLNCSPYEPWRAGVYADVTGADEFTQRLDTTGSTLAGSALAGATSLSVATASGPLWTTTAADFPFDVEVGGIRVTVTACSGSSSPQTFTVTGSTVAKALASGSSVKLWRPVGLGM